MKSNFALRTLGLLAAWLIFENFNLLAVHPGSGESNLPLNSGSYMPGSAISGTDICHEGCKSMESAVNRAPSILNSVCSGIRIPPYKIKTIVLDAGHGGKDPGCKGASAHEKENCLAIVLRLGAYIEVNYPEIRVIYTRDADFFVELNERAAIANRNKADLFISVHCNAVSSKLIQGAETYVLGLHRSKDNLDVAKRENSSIYLEEDYQKNYEGYDPNSPEAEIFASVWQSAYLEQSIILASYVQQFANAVAFREDRGVKQAGFLVLRETAMPSVLIETGYLTNATEDEFLASEEGQEQMALAIFHSFEAYKRHMETGKAIQNVADVAAPKKPVVTTANKPLPAKTVAQKTPVTAAASKASVEKPKTTIGKPVAGVKPGPGTQSAPKSYTIFLLAWPNKLDPNVGQLSLLANVKELNKEGKYHYYSGVYTSKAEAEKVLPEIQNMGFKTATIVPF
ncbi:MAG: N-acetylmuramoyl-L-alanine amidase [Saprospiraceae bacterium]|nr:N-acetylmuramoyl-L-alanine amidase [Saprospiraceae bacterium]